MQDRLPRSRGERRNACRMPRRGARAERITMQTSWQREGAGAELERLLGPLQRRLWWREGAHLVLRWLCLVFGALFVVAALAVTGLAPSPDGAVGVVAVG